MTCIVSTMVTVAVTITMVPALLVLTFPFQPLIRRVEIKTKRCLLAIFRKGKTAFVHPGSNQSKGRTFSMVRGFNYVTKISCVAHSYRKKVTRKSTLEYKFDNDVNSNTNARTQVPILLNKSMEESDLDSLDNSSSLEESLESSSLSSSNNKSRMTTVRFSR